LAYIAITLIDADVQSAHGPLETNFGRTLRFRITYLCFLTWIHMKATSAARERGTTGLIAVAGGATYVLHSPAFWALAIIAFGVAFFLFREA
jgi:hypothetical protein